MVIDCSKINLSDNQVFILENMDEMPVSTLGYIIDPEITINYNEISTLKFRYPKQVNGIEIDVYDDLSTMKIVNWNNICKFLITSVEEDNNGIKCQKTCTCCSLEFSFSYKNIILPASNYCLYNSFMSGTLMDYILQKMPDWSIGDISSNLLGKYRVLNECNGTNLYEFIKGTIQPEYGCIFDFDTNLKKINVISIEDAIPVKPIFLSHDNLLKTVKVSSSIDNIYTVLSVYGADNLSINECNPLGDKLYDLSYYANAKYMSQDMIDKYNAFSANYETNREAYGLISYQKALQISRLNVENAKLSTLKDALSALQSTQSELIASIASGDTSLQDDLAVINAEIASKNTEISNQESLLLAIQSEIDALAASLQAISDTTQFSNFFSEDEYKILSRFFRESIVSDSSFADSATSAYMEDNICNAISSYEIKIANAVISEVTGVANNTMYNIVGGTLSSTSDPSLSANVIRMLVMRNTTNNNLIMSAYLSDGSFQDQTYANSCIGITGTSASINATASTLSFTVTGNMLFDQNADYKTFSVQQDLYDFGRNCLKALSKPAYSFSVDAASFINMHEFKSFKDQLSIGKKVYINLDNGMGILNPFLISFSLNIDRPDSFKLLFSDKFSQGGVFDTKSLLEKSISMGNQLSVNQYNYSSFVNSGAATKVQDYMSKALDVAKQAVLSSGGIAPTLDGSGLLMRKLNTDGSYDPAQIKMINNCIAFSDDGFQNSVKMAIGKTTFNGSSLFGVVGDSLVGKILAGNNLIIESEKQSGGIASFKVDSDGCSLYNSNFTVTNGTVMAGMNGVSGFAIGDTNLYSDANYTVDPAHAYFYIDTNGNLVTRGIIQASDFLNSSGESMLDAYGRFKRGYLDLGNIQLDGTTGDITTSGNLTLGGNINITGNIAWGASNSPFTVQYSVDGVSSWHSTYASSDYFARYSYDGGTTWTAAIRIQGVNGTNGSDATVNFDNVNNVLKNYFGIDGGTTALNNSTISSPKIYAGKIYAGEGYGYSEMLATGLNVYTPSGQKKIGMGWYSGNYDYPYITLGVGSDESQSTAGMVKKFTNGVWIGNAASKDSSTPSGTGLFVDVTNGVLYRYINGVQSVIGSGSVTAVWG